MRWLQSFEIGRGASTPHFAAGMEQTFFDRCQPLLRRVHALFMMLLRDLKGINTVAHYDPQRRAIRERL